MRTGKIQQELQDFLSEKLEESGAERYVVGVSGGIDSATTLKLAVESVGPEKVSTWIIPGEPSREENMEDARRLCEELGVEIHEAEVKPVLDRFREETGFEVGERASGNARARIRMIYQYIDANQNRGLVLGSGNRTETLLGYFTKHGDGAVDLKPLGELYKTEVRELAEHMDLDQKFIEKEPTAGLWKGQTDRDELGYSYEVLDQVLKTALEDDWDEEEVAREVGMAEPEVHEILELHEGSVHKREGPETPDLDLQEERLS